MEENGLKKLAELARIDIPEEELQGLQGDLDSILEYVSQIQDVDASSTGDSNLTLGGEELHNVMREDNDPHEPGVYTEELLNAAPQSEKGYIKVKNIL